MTRARSLKKIIRARIAKTGERYTTARRHVLNQLPAARRLTVEVETPAAASPRATPPPATTKGGLSDAKSREKTGYGLDHWFAVLDAFDGVGKGHTAAARYLRDVHGIEGWYAQGITVAYERARGVRVVNQRCDGEFEVAVTKIVSGAASDIVAAFAQAAKRRRWNGGVDADLMNALSTGVSGRTAKGFTVKPNGQAHARFKWDGSSVLIQLWPKPKDKMLVSITDSQLANAAMVEDRRAKWRTALGALATFVSA